MEQLEFLYRLIDMILGHANDVWIFVVIYLRIKKNHSYGNKSEDKR
ncbi:hypothetical protein [Peptacetobacter hominis]|nr:hypothetical protein [Peptacetobacter hominis]